MAYSYSDRFSVKHNGEEIIVDMITSGSTVRLRAEYKKININDRCTVKDRFLSSDIIKNDLCIIDMIGREYYDYEKYKEKIREIKENKNIIINKTVYKPYISQMSIGEYTRYEIEIELTDKTTINGKKSYINNELINELRLSKEYIYNEGQKEFKDSCDIDIVFSCFKDKLKEHIKNNKGVKPIDKFIEQELTLKYMKIVEWGKYRKIGFENIARM